MFNFEKYTHNIGKEVEYNEVLYKVIGFFDNQKGLYYIGISDKDSVIINVLTTNVDYLNTDTISVSESMMDRMIKEDFNDSFNIELQNKNFIYLKKHFDKPFNLTYILTNNKVLKFDSKIFFKYKSNEDLYVYENKSYKLYINHKNIYKLYGKVRQSYIDLYNQMINDNMDLNMKKSFMKEFEYCLEYR